MSIYLYIYIMYNKVSRAYTGHECKNGDGKDEVELVANVGNEADREEGQHDELKYERKAGEKLHGDEPGYDDEQ